MIRVIVPEDLKKRRQLILGINVFVFWLLCALKKETVGIDIQGYKQIFESSAAWSWFDFSKVYYESGYTLLMQLFSKNGASFQLFNLFVYTAIYVPWFVFLNRYSKQPTLSLLIYLCYQFWVFNMSGLRQGIAMSICLMAYILLEKKTKKRIIAFCVIVLLAALIHRSAVVFYIVLGKFVFKPGWKTLTAFACVYAGSIIFRSRIAGLVNHFAGKYQVSQGFTLGGSFIMLVGFTAFTAVILFLYKREAEKHFLVHNKDDRESYELVQADMKLAYDFLFMMLCSIELNLLLNGSNVLRGASYASMFLTVSLPDSLSKCDSRSRLILDIAVSTFLLILFYHDVLLPNQLRIIPYQFFWQ